MAQSTPTETPMMRQFRNIKEQYPDALLLFRCGDFYETYCEDAVRASKVLNITLTHRSNGGSSAATIEMAGFPYHALDVYLPKLVRAGFRVAICDQLEDPKMTKKLVKRGVTELVTPGVSYSDTTLPQKENNYVSCVHFGKNVIGVSFLDISTGEFLVAEGSRDYVDKLITNFAPKEILYERGKKDGFRQSFGTKWFTFELEDWIFTEETAMDRLKKQFEVRDLKGLGVQHLHVGIIAAGAILYYLDMTQHLQTAHIRHLSRIEEDKYVWLDRFTVRNLELYAEQNGAVGLFDILDSTKSPMGARLLHKWLSFPLKDIDAIRSRQEVVEWMFRNPAERARLRELLASVHDLERLAGKIATRRILPRDLLQVYYALSAVEPVKEMASGSDVASFAKLGEQLLLCTATKELIRNTVSENAPSLLSKPGYIRDGVDAELDELRSIGQHGKEWLLRIQQREAERTGIQSLRIGYNNVFGYYLEVRNTYKHLVPSDWIRKQTLAQAERYITEELKEYEEKILGAESNIAVIESRIYNELLDTLSASVNDLMQDAHLLAQVDCLSSFADVAERYKYVCPVVDDSLEIDIREGRHPVIERCMPVGEQYVSNNVCLDNNSQQIIIITGPNMAGKSALLRQTALIVLMAQIGSFVPAESARIGVVDKIFTRVGANDNIALGESTFMVEMNEASTILNNLSERSLILFDELGRGTSTYDGISIAWAIVEYIHEFQGRPKTLFATHYHELNEMEKNYTRIHNYNVSVKEVKDKIIFLRKLVPGGSLHSFGIHVAKMAGMPASIVRRAEQVLHELESSQSESLNKQVAAIGQGKDSVQLSFFQLDDPVLEQVRNEIISMDINALTPLEALNKLNGIKKIVTGK